MYIKTLPIIAATFAAAALASVALAQQPQDPDYARLVKEWTTRPEFMTPLVDHLPKVAGVPSPKDVLGYYVGAPKKLTHVADLLRYYRALAAGSKRVKILPTGQTDEGREQVVVAIADEETIRNLDTYTRIPGEARRPARPERGTSQANHRAGQAYLHVHRRAT